MADELICWQINLQHSKTASATLVTDLEKLGKPCLTLIQEPHVYKSTIRNLNAKNYSLFSGGTKPRAAILAPRSLEVTVVEKLSDNDFTCCILNTQIKSKSLSRILVISGYLDITFNPQTTAEKMQQIVDFANENSFQMLLGIDSNSWSTMWGSKETNRRGEVLEEFIFRNNIQIMNEGGKPTFVTCRAESIIDLTLTTPDLSGLVHDWKVEDEDICSDHKKISFNLEINCPRFIKARNFDKADWNLFTRITEGHSMEDHPEWSASMLDNEVDRFNKMLQYALNKSCPEREIDMFKRRQPPWWSNELSSLRHEVRKLYQKASRTMLEEDWSNYRSTRTSYKNLIKNAKRTSWRDFTSEVTDTKSMARLIRNLRGTKLPQAGLFRDQNGEVAANMETSIQNVFDVMFPGNQKADEAATRYGTCSKVLMQTKAGYITEDKITSAIKSFKPNKSPGPDGVKPVMLRKLAGKSIKLLKTLFQVSVTLSYVPKAWREATVALLPKPNKGQYDKPNSYRPISLTSFLFKTLERVVLWEIEDTTLKQRPLSLHQHAYIRGRSCDTALTELVDRIEQGVHRGHYALGVFLDIQGAFNNVNPAKAVEAMNRRGIDSSIVRWYSFYLRNRTATIKINDTQTTRTLPRGLPQGGIISPLAWDLVIDNLLVHLNKEKNIKAVGYADDVAIVLDGIDPASMVDIAQSSINKACSWGRASKLNFNASKTEAVFFTRRRKLPTYKPLTVNGEKVEYSDGCKYLGVYIDKKLTWTQHVQEKIDKCKKLLHSVKATVGKRWGVNPQLVRWAYTGIVRPTLAYASHVWWSFTPSKTTITQLNRLSRLACLSIAKVHRSTPTKGLELIYNLAPLEFFLGEQAAKAYLRVSKMVKSNWTNPGGLPGHLGRVRNELTKLNIPHLVEEKILERSWTRFYHPNLDFDKTRNLSKEKTNTVYIYTDGSKIKDKSGFGFVIRRGRETRYTSSGYLGSEASVYQAEVAAILHASDHLNYLGYKGAKIQFRIDNQATVKSLASPFIKNSLVHECYLALQKLSNKNRVTLAWIKAHAGHEGNELADEAAKAGALLKVQGPEPFLWIPAATPKLTIRNHFHKKWCRQWKKSGEFLHTKKFYPRPSNRMSRALGKISREQLSLLVQVITGHCNLLYHARHYKESPETEDTLCRLCLEDDEKPWHILTDCPALSVRRETLFGWTSVLTNTVSWSPQRLLTFFTEHSIQQLFDQVR